jgi:hypothetical protein
MNVTSQNDLTSIRRLIASLPTPARKDKPPQKANKEVSKARRKIARKSKQTNRRKK